MRKNEIKERDVANEIETVRINNSVRIKAMVVSEICVEKQQSGQNGVSIVESSSGRIPSRGRNKSKVTFWQLNCDVILWTVVNVTNNILSLAARLLPTASLLILLFPLRTKSNFRCSRHVTNFTATVPRVNDISPDNSEFSPSKFRIWLI